MDQIEFPKNIGRLTRKHLTGDRRNSNDSVYWLNRSSRYSKKYHALRNIEFTVRPMAKNTFRVLVNNQRFDEAYSYEDASIILIRAFDRECIRAGIDSASPRFYSTLDEGLPTRRRP